MTMFKVFIYIECEPNERSKNPYYADKSLSLSVEFRPLVGDIYIPENPPFLNDLQVNGVKVDSLNYCGNNIFHAYCSEIEADKSYLPYYGLKNMEGTLVAHTVEQMKDFPKRYKKEYQD